MLKVDKKHVTKLQTALELLTTTKDTQKPMEELLAGLNTALWLEASTIPPYLVAAWSIEDSYGFQNRKIRDLILGVAKEEMLHMMGVANIIAATGNKPQIATKDIVLNWGSQPLPLAPEGSKLIPQLAPFSLDLLHDLFMEIEKPEGIQDPKASETSAGSTQEGMESDEVFVSIGVFYKHLINLLEGFRAHHDDPFKNGDEYNQIPIDADFRIKKIHHEPIKSFKVNSIDKAKAIMDWIVEQGEGSAAGPLDADGDPSHYYRFAEIYYGGEFTMDENAKDGYFYDTENKPLKCDFSKVRQFDPNPKMKDFPKDSKHYKGLRQFNIYYTKMFKHLQAFYDNAKNQRISDSIFDMTTMTSFVDALLDLEPGICPSFEWVEEEVAYVKIHPAIGVARLANNEDYFEFYEANAKNFSPPEDYMSAGGPLDPQPGKQRLKRQAVQFKAFAYDENHKLLGELKNVMLDSKLEWSADLGNRKLHNYTSKRAVQDRSKEIISPVEGQATAKQPDEIAAVNAKNPWNAEESINLGYITGTGLFIPPKGDVTRKNENSPIDKFPANEAEGMKLEATDTTCDGSITATVYHYSGQKLDIPVLPAWVIVSPGQHCPSLTPARAEEMANNFGAFKPNNSNKNRNWIVDTKKKLGIVGEIYDPTGLDTPMMLTINGDYDPGMEANMGYIPRMEKDLKPFDLFYPRAEGFIGSNEIRILPHTKNQSIGAKPGQLTSGLCSTWQGDMSQCLNYWTSENPYKAFAPDNQIEIVVYSEGDTEKVMTDPEEVNEFMDFRGIVAFKQEGDDLDINLVYDPNRP